MFKRGWIAWVVVGGGLLMAGCASCSSNGGWERQMNPFCVETNSLAGMKAPPA